jgi:hypothetical protein
VHEVLQMAQQLLLPMMMTTTMLMMAARLPLLLGALPVLKLLERLRPAVYLRETLMIEK